MPKKPIDQPRIFSLSYYMEEKAKIDQLVKLIKEAKNMVALTGAGVSTLSGIRDFRGKDGLYKEMDAEKIFSLDFFLRDPSFYYNNAGTFIYNIDEKEASIVHTTLGELEQKGRLKALITQNIDLLHQKGGSKNVIEIHGSPTIHYCLYCTDVEMSFAEAAAIVRAGNLPECPKCGKVLKPAITFFGENLPANALVDAMRISERADLMLVLGTTLTVYPAASMPEYTLHGGGKLVIVNNMPTPMDRYATLLFDDLEEVFSELKSRLNSFDNL